MIHADLDKILPEDDALEKITSIIEEVEEKQELFIITKSGRPAAAIINIDYLEELTGNPVPQKSEIKETVENEEPLLQEEMPPTPASSTGIKSTVDLRLNEDQETPESPAGPAIPTPTRLETTEPQPMAATTQSPPPTTTQPLPPMPTTPPITPPANPITPPLVTPTTPPTTPTQPTPATNQPYDNLPPEDPNSGSPMG